MKIFYILVSLILVGCTYAQSPSVSSLNEDGKFLGNLDFTNGLF